MLGARMVTIAAVAVVAGGLMMAAAVWPLPGGVAHARPAGGTWRVPVGPGRALVLTAPEGWRVRVQRPVVGPPTVLMEPAEGRAFRLLLTPLPAGGPLATGDVRDFLRGAGARLAERSVEGRLRMEPLPGVEDAWFYRLTDRNPGKGYRHLAQGARRLDGYVLTFTFLSHVPEPPALAEALRVVATASVE